MTAWPPFRQRHIGCIFLNESVWISIEVSLKFVPNGPVNNIPASDKWWLDANLFEPITTPITDTYMRESASMRYLISPREVWINFLMSNF